MLRGERRGAAAAAAGMRGPHGRNCMCEATKRNEPADGSPCQESGIKAAGTTDCIAGQGWWTTQRIQPQWHRQLECCPPHFDRHILSAGLGNHASSSSPGREGCGSILGSQITRCALVDLRGNAQNGVPGRRRRSARSARAQGRWIQREEFQPTFNATSTRGLNNSSWFAAGR